MKSSLISIVIVNYNGEKWLKQCLDSLFTQTYKNFEIILVDNASGDNSIQALKNNYDNKQIKIITSEKNLGFAGGNNLGIQKATGEFVLLLNNDTWLDNDFLEKIISFYNQNNFDVIAPLENDYTNKTKKRYVIKIDLLGQPTYIYKNIKDSGFYLSGVCLFFKKEFYLSTLGLDNDFFMYFEEIDWFWRLNLLKKKFYTIESLLVHHASAGGTSRVIRYNSFLWRNQNALQMLIKNYSWYNLIWVLPIYLFQNIVEMIFFFFILKPKIAFSYIEGWFFNIKNIKRTFKKRKWIQKNRLVSDWQIVGKMYLGFGKLVKFNRYFLKPIK